jgi:hypothetical protein
MVENRALPSKTPQRRRNDPAVRAAAMAAAAADADKRPRRRGSGLLGGMLFLIGCAAGGALATAFGLPRAFGL